MCVGEQAGAEAAAANSIDTLNLRGELSQAFHATWSRDSRDHHQDEDGTLRERRFNLSDLLQSLSRSLLMFLSFVEVNR